MTRNELSTGEPARRRQPRLPAPACCAVLAGALLLSGCGSPNAANITLRKEKQDLQDRIASLEQQLQVTQAELAGLKQNPHAPSTLAADRLKRMYTVHDVQLGRFTGGADLDPQRPGDEALKIYLTPRDEAGDPLKATGQVVVEVFNLAASSDLVLGRWEYSSQDLKEAWRGLGPLQAFVLTAPWQTIPEQRQLTVRVIYTDELTGRRYTVTKDVEITPPPATQPTTKPS